MAIADDSAALHSLLCHFKEYVVSVRAVSVFNSIGVRLCTAVYITIDSMLSLPITYNNKIHYVSDLLQDVVVASAAEPHQLR